MSGGERGGRSENKGRRERKWAAFLCRRHHRRLNARKGWMFDVGKKKEDSVGLDLDLLPLLGTCLTTRTSFS